MSSTVATSLNILAIGASRNIGYYAALKLLSQGATVTFLLRNPSVFDNDVDIQPYLSSGKARIVKGDVLVKNDIAQTWSEATRDSTAVDYLFFTPGGKPTMMLSKGAVLDNPNVCTLAILDALCTLPQNFPPPGILAVSSISITPESRSLLPFSLKPLYSYVLSEPHADKLPMERILNHVTEGWRNSAKGSELSAKILPSGWKSTEGLPAEGILKRMSVLRPSMFTDGKSQGEKYEEQERKGKEPYRVSTEEIGGYTISRRDVAHFIMKRRKERRKLYFKTLKLIMEC